jgi:hypothetical protein
MSELLLAPVAIFSIASLFFFYRSASYAALIILAVSLLETWVIKLPSFSLGLQIYPQDIVFLGIFVTALPRLIAYGGENRVPLIWLIFGLLIFFSFGRGILQFGTLAGVDFRNFFYFWSGTLYFTTFTFTDQELKRLMNILLLAGALMAAIVIFRWAGEILGLGIASSWEDAAAGNRFRVVNSGQAHVIATAFLVALFRLISRHGEKTSKVLIVVLGIVIVGAQHRSVWLSTFLALTALLFIPGKHKAALLGNMVLFGVIGAILLSPLLLSGLLGDILQTVATSADNATRINEGSFGARLSGWTAMLEHWFNSGILVQLFGDPFGGGYGGSPTSPHNYLIQVLLRTGIIGVVLILLFYFGLMLRLRLKAALSPVNPYFAMMLTLVISQFTYYLPYAPRYEHGIVLGVALALARQRANIVGGEDESTNSTESPQSESFSFKAST